MVKLLAGHVQRCAARHKETELRGLGEEVDELRACLDHLLQVVQHEYDPLVCDAVRDSFYRRSTDGLGYAEGPGHTWHDQADIVDCGQGHEDDRLLRSLLQLPSDRQRQAGLP